MNFHVYSFGAFVLAFMVSGLPAIVFANESTSTLETGWNSISIQNQSRVQFENSTTSLSLFEKLEAKIELSRQEIDREDASTTPEDRDVTKRTNTVRLAVHALLDSREFLGGIGEQVSEIAKEMNDSIATTTNAELKIHSRGFLTRFFFGGDKDSAQSISLIVVRNQQLIIQLTALLDQASISADMRAMLTAQLTVLEDAQIRLNDLAEKERNSWGFFSWRFEK